MVGSDPEDDYAFIAGDGEYAIEVVSESRHQGRLEWLAQGRGEDPAEYTCTALLAHEPDNPFDPSAVSVSIDGVRVGYLPPTVAGDMVVAMRTLGIDRATCDAIIEGGWYRSAEDKGDFCVRLDLSSDFVPESDAVPRSQPGIADAHPRPRNVVHDLVLGAAATVAMFVALGTVWLYMQSQSGVDRRFAVASSTAQVAAVSPPRQHDRPEPTALARAAAGSAGTVASQATPAVAASETTARAIAAGSSDGVNNPRAVIVAVEAADNTAAALPPEPETAVAPSGGSLALGGPGPTQVEAASRVTLPASTAAEADHAVIATLPAVAPEIDPPPHRPAPVAAAPVAQELDPSAAVPVFQSALPPLPRPAPPQAEHDGDGPSVPAAVESREPPQAGEAVAVAKRDARSSGNARTRRALARSRNAVRSNDRLKRRPVQYRPDPPRPAQYRRYPPPAAQAGPASAPRMQVGAPFNSAATQMIEGLAKEWSTQALPVAPPRQRQ
jgi:hypothetical protein